MKIRKNKEEKSLVVSYQTWTSIIEQLANKFNKDYMEMEDILINTLYYEEDIKFIMKTNKQSNGIIEFNNIPKHKCHTMYNELSFIDEYSNKIKNNL